MSIRKRRAESARRGSLGRQVRGALVGVAIVTIALVVAFARHTISGDGYELHALFANANQLKPGSVVRMAGTDIGRVESVGSADDDRALVTMRMKDDAPPLFADARLAIRPRLAFEGNFYVDVQRGTPGSPPVRPGQTIPVTRTSHPVQLDQLLTTLDDRTRTAGKRSAAALSDALAGVPGSAAPGSAGFRRSVAELSRTLDGLGTTARAMRGRRTGDLPRATSSITAFSRVLARDPRALSDVVTDYARVVGVLARRDAELGATMRDASDLLTGAPGSLRRIDRMLPELRSFATDLRPALRALPATARATSRALVQVDRVSRAGELPTTVSALRPTFERLPQLQRQLEFALPLVSSIGTCLSRQIVPALDSKLQDGPHTVDQPVWQEVLHATANLTGGSPGFDANGTTVRIGLGPGENLLWGTVPGMGEVVARVAPGLEGARPAGLGVAVMPPKRPDQDCATQRRVDMTASTAEPFAGSRLKPLKGATAPDERQTRKILQQVRDSLQPRADRPRERRRDQDAHGRGTRSDDPTAMILDRLGHALAGGDR